jgi:hypothetical protein
MLVSMQSFNGSFKCSDAIVALLQTTSQHVDSLAQMHALARDVVVTALVLLFLNEHAMHMSNEWVLIAEKVCFSRSLLNNSLCQHGPPIYPCCACLFFLLYFCCINSCFVIFCANVV